MPHILLIEDNEHQRRIMRERLQMEGFQITDTPYGDEGVRLAKTQHPDLIMIDIMVPRMNGWEIMEALHADPATKDTPYIVLTGAKTLPEDIERSMALGSQAHFAKGITPLDDILSEIRTILGLKKVLILDANTERAGQIRDVLQRNRMLTTVLTIGADAIKRLSRIKPDLIILSNLVVGMSPSVFLQRFCDTKEAAGIPILMVGGGSVLPNVPKGLLTLKSLDYPCPDEQLLEAVQDLLK